MKETEVKLIQATAKECDQGNLLQPQKETNTEGLRTYPDVPTIGNKTPGNSL